MHSSGALVAAPPIPGCRNRQLVKTRVTPEEQLREKLRKIEAPFARAATSGEKAAADAAADRIRRQFETASKTEPSQEHKFSIPEPWSRQLFMVLCRRYGVRPFRDSRVHRQPVIMNAPANFVRDVLWPELEELSDALTRLSLEITDKITREEVHAATGDAEEIEETRRLR
jgi:hypothetical protein